ncbi:MAG: LexA family protein [Gaiellales bacterium]
MTKHDRSRGARAMAFISEYRSAHPYGPSFREVMRGIGIASTGACYHVLSSLRDEQLIEWDEGIGRSIRLTEAGHQTVQWGVA